MELYGINIPEDQQEVIIRQIYCVAMENLRTLSTECPFYKVYWSYGSIPATVKASTKDLYQVFLSGAIQYILDKVTRAKIYDYDANRIANIYSKYAVNYISACKSVYADYCEIQGNAAESKRIREEAKESRGRFVGGGFGISGAAKGIAMAGAANLATGLAYSAGNMIGNAFTQANANSQSDSLYRSAGKKLYDALQKDFLMGVDVLENILVASIGPHMKNPFNNQQLGKAKAVMQNIKDRVVPEAEQKKLLVESMVKDAPYYDEMYLFAYKQFGDDGGNLIKFAKFFGKNDISERIKNKIEQEKRWLEHKQLEQKVFGINYTKVQEQLSSDGKFTDFDDFYFYPISGMYIDQSFPVILKKLSVDLKKKEAMPNVYLESLILIDDHPNKTEAIQKYRTLCDPLGIFQPGEIAYCFINLGITKESKGILITSKGLYFSPNCKIDRPFMCYDKIDGIVEDSPFGTFIYENERTVGIDATLNKYWASLLTFIVLYFKYGEEKYTGKIVSKIAGETQGKLEKIARTTQEKEEKFEMFIGLIMLLIFAAIIFFVFRSCGA